MKLRNIFTLIVVTLVASFMSGCSYKAYQSSNSGIEYYNNGQYEEAQKKFLEAVNEGADSANDYVNLGMTSIALNDNEKALEYFNKAVAADKKSSTAHKGLAIAYLNTGNYDKVVGEIALVLEYADGKVTDLEKDALNYRAKAECMLGKYDDAIKTYGILIEVGYKQKNEYFERGKTYLAKGDITKAMEDFKSVIDLDKNDYDTYYGIYCALKDAGYEDESIQMIKGTLSINADDAKGYYNKGKTYYILNDMDKCVTELTQAREAGSIEASYLLGVVYMQKAEYQKAEPALLEVIASENGKSAEAYNALGQCYFRQANYDKAISCFEQGLTDYEDDETLLINMAVAYEYKQDFSMAAIKFNDVLNKYPDNEVAKHELEFLSGK
ncbi:tetratricopeptide repeat protein [Falcatimonas sp. MSJ-15]|uniref:tetratricopeptide repeat protein n=1 Tax=Falcatimonas sp. MSJ-15 TaxID=2841515 RepID=UPI001C10E734|nr:tetratricopeptide repeat protein [Falcatimonas sp. MSJ-15]MBU5471539.1 tetratricopeptide repeat protein [Falcatimonas sp. MSJ-15]